MFFNIAIDEALLTFLASRKLKVEELFIIVSFNLNKLDALKTLLNGRTGDQIIAYLQPLVRKQMLRILAPEVQEFDWDNYELTEVADEIFDYISVNVSETGEETLTPEVKKPSAKQKLLTNEGFADFMKKFIALWPEGVTNSAGTYLRTNNKDIIQKMINFVLKYKYGEETILKATEQYLQRQSRDGYAFCNAAHFFVSKLGVSKLADECEKVMSGKDDESQSGTWITRM